jgi:hypothetical protein
MAAAKQDRSEVSRIVAGAVEKIGDSSRSSAAQGHYQSGRAFAEMGDIQASAHHYEKAAQLGPNGEWGRAGRAALDAPGVELEDKSSA